MSLKKFIGKIHLWLGLASGLVVIVLGITGCMLSFEDELIPRVYAYKLFVDQPDTSPLLLSESLQVAQTALGDSIPIERVRIANDPEASYLFTHYSTHREPKGIWYGDDVKHSFWVYVNPYTAQLIDVENHTFEFFRVVNVLHWRLLLINEIGQPIVGISTFVFLITLITGLVLWWPHNKKALKINTWFRWKPTTKWKRKNYDLHNIVGFYSMFFLIFISLTGLVWAFDWVEDGMKWMANGGETLRSPKIKTVSTPISPTPGHAVDRVLLHLKTHHPEAESYSISLPEDSLKTIRASVSYGSLPEGLSIYFDQYSGEPLATALWDDKTNGDKVRAYNKDIHTGAVGGLTGKIIGFFMSFFAASLPVTGFLVWWGRKQKGNPPRTKRDSNNPCKQAKPVIKRSPMQEDEVLEDSIS